MLFTFSHRTAVAVGEDGAHRFARQQHGILQGFQRRGMIEYKQGQMSIKHRKKLECVSCECYFIVKKEYQKLTGSS